MKKHYEPEQPAVDIIALRDDRDKHKFLFELACERLAGERLSECGDMCCDGHDSCAQCWQDHFKKRLEG